MKDWFLLLLFLEVASPSQSLPDTLFWDNVWPSDTVGDLDGTVLFAQSQIMPSKHGVSGDTQPHLTAMRKALVLFQPQAADPLHPTLSLTVRDADGMIISGDNPIIMNNPEDIPKQAGWIELDEVPEFPLSLDNPYVVQYQSNLDLANDPEAVFLTSKFIEENNNEVEVRYWDGSWSRNLYLPDGNNVPAGSKVQVTCDSGYTVNVNYPNTQTGGWRTRTLSRGTTLIIVLADNNIWVAQEDLEHTEYVFGENFYSTTLDAEWVQPGMTLEFQQGDQVGTLGDIEIGGATEILITTLDAGFLTEPRNEFYFANDSTAHREYYETVPVSRLVVAQYEPLHLTEVMLPTGTLYDTVSAVDGGWHTGDMRQYTGKLLLSHGIDMANYGIHSSLGQSESSHPYTCALLAAHNTVGMYQNGRVVHGGSGGNGMITLDSSIGNEMSHEAGHNYGLGHYVGGFDGSVHRSAQEIDSSWGWDSDLNIFIPNFSSDDTGEDQCLNNQCESPYLGKYKYGTDAMSGGSPQWGANRFTLYTPHVAERIQVFLEGKAIWDPTSSTGFRKYNSITKEMEEFSNTANGNKVPRLYRVSVTTIVGYYDPDSERLLTSYIFPALYGAYGFVYDDDSDDVTSEEGCQLRVETTARGMLVFDLSTSIDSSGMNKFHVNVATEDGAHEAKIFCQNELRAQRLLEEPQDELLTYTVNGVQFARQDEPSVEPSGEPSAEPSSAATEVPTISPTVAPPINETCADEPDFEFGRKNRTCAYVRRKKKYTAKRCNRKLSDGTRVYAHCKETCGICVAAMNGMCADHPDFKFKGKRWRNCNWVGENPNERCKKRNWGGSKVNEYCPETCWKCNIFSNS